MTAESNTALALAGGTSVLLIELILELVNKGMLTAPEALNVVQRTRKQLEAPNQPGSVRASIYLEPLEEELVRRSKPG